MGAGGGDAGLGTNWSMVASVSSKHPKKPKRRKKLKDILLKLKKQKHPLEILGIPTRITLKKKVKQ